MPMSDEKKVRRLDPLGCSSDCPEPVNELERARVERRVDAGDRAANLRA